MNVLGIDPGLTGAFCLINTPYPTFWDMPILEIPKGRSKKTESIFDVAATWNLINKLSENTGFNADIAYVEWNSVMPGEGAVSGVRIGEGRMMIAAMLQAAGIPWEKIRPLDWTKPLKVPGKKDPTAVAARYELACRLYPSVASELITPRGRKLDGRIDALLIAHRFKNPSKEVA